MSERDFLDHIDSIREKFNQGDNTLEDKKVFEEINQDKQLLADEVFDEGEPEIVESNNLHFSC
jgi:hypothetical protein